MVLDSDKELYASEVQSGGWSGFLDTLGGLAKTAATAYATVATAKLVEKAGNPSSQPSQPAQPSQSSHVPGAPVTSQPWFVPAAIGAVVLLVVMLVSGRRR